MTATCPCGALSPPVGCPFLLGSVPPAGVQVPVGTATGGADASGLVELREMADQLRRLAGSVPAKTATPLRKSCTGLCGSSRGARSITLLTANQDRPTNVLVKQAVSTRCQRNHPRKWVALRPGPVLPTPYVLQRGHPPGPRFTVCLGNIERTGETWKRLRTWPS